MNIELIKKYLRIDYEEDDILLNSIYNMADLFLEGAISKWREIKINPKYQSKVELLLASVMQEMYDNRGLNSEKPLKLNLVMSSLISQLDLLEVI